MKSFKEIVTKAVIGKGKKLFKNSYDLTLEDNVDTVLGCWVINHKLSGKNNNGSVLILGNFDVNIWYSYDNNTKTNVAIKKINYREQVNLNLKNNTNLTNDSEIIIECLKNPTCVDVSLKQNTINYVIEKELGIEIIGDTKVKIAVEDDYDEYEIIKDDISEEVLLSELDNIDKEVNENYLG